MSESPDLVGMRYELRLTTTAAAIGYFACYPTDPLGFDEALDYLRQHPNDEFMHKYLLERVATLSDEHMRHIAQAARGSDPFMMALLYEAALLHGKLAALGDLFSREEIERFSGFTPLVYIRSNLQKDQAAHNRWIEGLAANILEHKPLPALADLPPLPGMKPLGPERDGSVLEEIHRELTSEAGACPPRRPPEEVAKEAIDALMALDIPASNEMRHVASLSPIALFRRWRIDHTIRGGRHDYTLSGIQTSYGRGFSLDVARASYSMEIVERSSSFASFSPERVMGYVREHSLTHARHSELVERNVRALNPNDLRVEVHYPDAPLYWIEGEERTEEGMRPILVPAQCIFLFCNLDEINLFSGLGSTGLASGCAMEQAKVSGLMEVIERDGEAVSVFDPRRCFRLEASTPEVAELLADYEAKNLRVQFMDLTNELGFPCYKCFVVGPGGEIIRGTGANLDGKRAILSALTETPCPYPDGPPSGPGLDNLPVRRLEDLPDYSTGCFDLDLALIERVLLTHGYRPIYVDLTREDLRMPVMRAIVPGLEIMADFDQFSRVSPRLFANYLKALD